MQLSGNRLNSIPDLLELLKDVTLVEMSGNMFIDISVLCGIKNEDWTVW